MECPYVKVGPPGTYSVKAGGHRSDSRLHADGSFELGFVGVGMEHEMLVDGDWAGEMHMFQLWVNLPAARKFDAPRFQVSTAAAIPVVVNEKGATVRVVHGDYGGRAAPTTCDAVAWQSFPPASNRVACARVEMTGKGTSTSSSGRPAPSSSTRRRPR